ncbi:MAG: amidase [Alphaproteobacteria bacterium]|nr:amidase [Alphaproteobacteria bacterium]
MTSLPEYESFDGLGLAELVRTRQVKPEELLDAAIERVEARNPKLNAVVNKLYDYGRAAIAAGLPEGPFTGVPYLIKEIASQIGGVPTTRGSRFFADVVPPADSEHVKRLKRAGLVIFGKTNTCELGASLTCEPRFHGPTRNPWNLGLTPGGSSGGAAAAVASGMAPMAHASDGFGSIRAPASCCGLVGLKPTRARNTFAPYQGEGMAGLSAEHAVTLSVRDSAALLDATAGAGEGDPYAAPPPAGSYLAEVKAKPGRLRIAFTKKAPNGTPLERDPIRVLEETARLCEQLGHGVEEADPKVDGDLIWPAFNVLIATSLAVQLASHPKGHKPGPDDIETITRRTAEIGERTGAMDYMRASVTAHHIGRQMGAFHRTYDVLLTPALATAPPPLGHLDMMMDDVREYWRRVETFSPFTVWFNETGQPAMVIPIGVSGKGLPVCVQLVGRSGDEATLFRLAGQLEQARSWAHRLPKTDA